MGLQVIKYSYARIARRRRWTARGFRLTSPIRRRRLSVRGLRAKLWTLLGIMARCTRNVRLLTTGLVAAAARGARRRAPAAAVVVAAGAAAQAECGGNGVRPRRPPCMRSNSFYARAVADCLDFIKGSNTAAATVGDDDSRRAAGGAAAAISACRT